MFEVTAADTGRGNGLAPQKVDERFALMLERLTEDPLWATEYDQFVNDKSFAKPEEVISFADALAATTRIIARNSLPEETMRLSAAGK
jgi:hypothetical protein